MACAVLAYVESAHVVFSRGKSRPCGGWSFPLVEIIARAQAGRMTKRGPEALADNWDDDDDNDTVVCLPTPVHL